MNTRQYLFTEYNEDCIRHIYNEVVIEGWSLIYTLRRISGGMHAFKREAKNNLVLQEIHKIYKERIKRHNRASLMSLPKC